MANRITKSILFLSMLAAIIGITSCYYDNEEYLYPGGNLPCDTTNVSYNLDVAPVLASRCNGCHGGAAPAAGIRLDTYSDLLVYVNNGMFKGSINHASGYSPMPKNAVKLPTCELAKINAWVNNGAPNN